MIENPPKWPSIGHWPYSETVHRDDSYCLEPEAFLGREVVITEKLDGGNTCLWNGNVYARSTGAPASDGWFAMVKKHHLWKIAAAPATHVFNGEDLYGLHSIPYDPMPEDKTFRLFCVRFILERTEEPKGITEWFYDWDSIVQYGFEYNLPVVPMIHRGIFQTVDEITNWFRRERLKPSVLGGEREGFVMRQVGGFERDDFASSICKYVRPNHVQTDEHWRQNWKPCALTR